MPWLCLSADMISQISQISTVDGPQNLWPTLKPHSWMNAEGRLHDVPPPQHATCNMQHACNMHAVQPRPLEMQISSIAHHGSAALLVVKPTERVHKTPKPPKPPKQPILVTNCQQAADTVSAGQPGDR